MALSLRPDPDSGFRQVVGIGGIGSGIAFQLDGEHTLGREESRLGALLPGRDYCKLHIVEHYIAVLMGCEESDASFQVAAIGVVGDDAPGRQLMEEMSRAGIDTGWVRKDASRPTLYSVCFFYPDRTGGNITASNSASEALNEADLEQAADTMQQFGKRCIALCLPEVPLEVRKNFLDFASQWGNFRAASFTLAEIGPARELGLFSSIDLLALNEEEASALVGYARTPQNRPRFLEDCAAVLTAWQPAMQIVVSAGREGAYGFHDGVWNFCPAPRVSAVSTAGAGDALLSGVLCGLASGLPLISQGDQHARAASRIDSALELGVLLASFSVTSPDTIHFKANLEELERFASSLNICFGEKFQRAIHRPGKTAASDVASRQTFRG